MAADFINIIKDIRGDGTLESINSYIPDASKASDPVSQSDGMFQRIKDKEANVIQINSNSVTIKDQMYGTSIESPDDGTLLAQVRIDQADVALRHDDVVTKHAEVLVKHEDVVTKHEDVTNAYTELVASEVVNPVTGATITTGKVGAAQEAYTDLVDSTYTVTFADGITEDVEGKYGVVSTVANNLFRNTPTNNNLANGYYGDIVAKHDTVVDTSAIVIEINASLKGDTPDQDFVYIDSNGDEVASKSVEDAGDGIYYKMLEAHNLANNTITTITDYKDKVESVDKDLRAQDISGNDYTDGVSKIVEVGTDIAKGDNSKVYAVGTDLLLDDSVTKHVADNLDDTLVPISTDINKTGDDASDEDTYSHIKHAASNAASAEASSNKAADWAEKTDGEVESGNYSAKHHATAASTSEDNAATSETNAKTSEDNAKASEDNAATSESNASTSETNAGASEDKAGKWATEDEDVEVESGKYSAKHHAIKGAASAAAASTSEDNASTSESNAATSETNAKTSEDNSKTSEDNSKTSEDNSKTSEDNAKVSEDNAKASEDNSAASEALADRWANEDRGTEVESGKYSAKHYASYANDYMNDADDSAAEAQSSEDAAKDSEIAAGNSETKAGDWAEKAVDEEVESGKYSSKHHATKAGESEDAAATSETNAKASEDKALDWAEKAKDEEVETGNYSAKHYSEYANDYMDNAKTYRDRALEYSDDAAEAKDAAVTAKDDTQAIADSVHGLSAKANTLVAGSDADVSYDSDENELTLGIPKGDKGDKGDPFNIDAVGQYSDRADYDDQNAGYAFLSTNGYGPQPEEVTDTNFDGTLDIDADTTLTWDGDDLELKKYLFEVTLTDLTAGSVILYEDDLEIFNMVANDTYTISYKMVKNGLKFVTDADYDGNLTISIIRDRDQGSNVFFKNSDDSADWSVGSPFGKGDVGDAGNGISSISRTSGDGSAGTVDTYTMVYTNGGYDTFTVTNGNAFVAADAVAAVVDEAMAFTNKDITSLSNEVAAKKIHIKVKSSDDLTKGTVVTVTGYNSTDDVVEVAATSAQTDVAFGIVVEDISADTVGAVVNTGIVTTLDTSAFSVGDKLYSAGDGGFTTTRPEAEYQTVANVLRSDADYGVIFTECTATKFNISNVDNTSDADKPISTATQAALDDKLDDTQLVSEFQDDPDHEHIASEKLVKDTADDISADINTLNGNDTVTGSVDNRIKTNVTDNLVDNLTTDDAEKYLSARQGKVAKDAIDNINGDVSTTGSIANKVRNSRSSVATGTVDKVRFDKVLAAIDVVQMKYVDDVLDTVRYDGDGDTDAPYFRDILEYTDGKLTKVKHYHDAADLDTASGITKLAYDGDALDTVTYTE